MAVNANISVRNKKSRTRGARGTRSMGIVKRKEGGTDEGDMKRRRGEKLTRALGKIPYRLARLLMFNLLQLLS